MKNEFVKLNEIIELTNGAHILYVYEDLECYANNATSFIISGIELEHQLLIIDNHDRCILIKEKLESVLSKQELTMVHCIDSFEFYRMYGDFHTESIVHHFQEIVEPFLKKDIPIRTWAHVDWKEQEDIACKLKEFEDRADYSVNKAGLVSVCAYNANTLTVPLQMNMMRNHEYFMTDKEFVRSNLYEHSKKSVVFPSLSIQRNMQTEMDLYKQKLDFIHVISHEVRNPLTVIKAYCSIILDQPSELSEENLMKIGDIRNYVDVIDHEMKHIIQTEQMLSNDLLWRKEVVDLLPVIREVYDFMTIKAQTQNQKLQITLNLQGNEQLIANKIGLKLVLSNLLSNAIKYSDEQSLISFTISTEMDTIVLKVVDQGIGMSKEQITKLFKKYGKLNPEKSGAGIGLYMVKKLVDHFEGMIEINSQVGQGTEVTVTLPAARPIF